MVERAKRNDSTLEQWAIKQQISYIMGVQKMSRQRLYRMLVVGSVGIPAYLVSAYKLSVTLDTSSEIIVSKSILAMIVISPLLVSAFYLLYMSERDAGHKYGAYLRQQMERLKSQETNFEFWEAWVETERRSNGNYRYDVQRSLAIYVLMGAFYAVSCIFASAAFAKIVSGSATERSYGYLALVIFFLYGWMILKYSRSMPVRIRNVLLD